jgi:hypothetical protein
LLGRLAGLLASGLILSEGAVAQTDVERGETVLSRQRPDYDPLGIRLGGFKLRPSLVLGESYDTNIFATRTNTVSDFKTTIAPSVDLRSH